MSSSLPALAEFWNRSRYAALLGPAQTLLVSGRKQFIRQQLRASVPDQPGVYAMVDRQDQVIYVGMSTRLQKRLPCYFSSRARRKKESHTGRRAKGVLWQPAGQALIAELRERELIRQFRPDRNVEGQPTQMKLGYVTLLDQPAPALTLRATQPRRQPDTWGPVPYTRGMRAAVAELNLHFALRDCPRATPIHFAGTPQVDEASISCMRAELKTCLAPCIGGCTERAYRRAVGEARRFLNGQTASVYDALSQSMQAAAAERQFEKAARLRDRLHALQRLDRHLRRFHDWRAQAHFVYPVTAIDGQCWWIIVVRGVIVELVPQPQNAEDRGALSTRLKQFREQACATSMTGPDEFESARLLLRWFRRHPDEAPKQFTLGQAQRRCRLRKNSAAAKHGDKLKGKSLPLQNRSAE